LGASQLVDLELVKGALEETFAARPKLVPINLVALSKGFEIGMAHAPAHAAH
jgi:hypothetical protein